MKPYTKNMIKMMFRHPIIYLKNSAQLTDIILSTTTDSIREITREGHIKRGMVIRQEAKDSTQYALGIATNINPTLPYGKIIWIEGEGQKYIPEKEDFEKYRFYQLPHKQLQHIEKSYLDDILKSESVAKMVPFSYTELRTLYSLIYSA